VKVKVDPDECTGCALCVDICPEVFEMLDDLAVAKQDEVLSGQKSLVCKPLRIVLLRLSE